MSLQITFPLPSRRLFRLYRWRSPHDPVGFRFVGFTCLWLPWELRWWHIEKPSWIRVDREDLIRRACEADDGNCTTGSYSLPPAAAESQPASKEGGR